MDCLRPIKVKNPITNQYQRVACGKCSACRANKMLIYRNQLDQEQHNSVETYFITLTYDEDHVPYYQMHYNASVNVYTLTCCCDRDISSEDFIVLSEYDNEQATKVIKRRHSDKVAYPYFRDVQLYIKRLRFYYEKNYNGRFRFYTISEYGPKHLRPHFHLLLFFDRQISNEMFVQLSEAWSYGFVDAQLAKQASQYLSQYVSSANTLPRFYSEIRELRPRCTHSAYLGKRKMDRSVRELLRTSDRDIIYSSFAQDEKTYAFNLSFGWQNICRLFPRCSGVDVQDAKAILQYGQFLPYTVDYVRKLNKEYYEQIKNDKVSLRYMSTLVADTIVQEKLHAHETVTDRYIFDKYRFVPYLNLLNRIIYTNDVHVLREDNTIDADQLIYLHGLIYRISYFSLQLVKVCKGKLHDAVLDDVNVTYSDLLDPDILSEMYIHSKRCKDFYQNYDLYRLNRYYRHMCDIIDKSSCLNIDDVVDYINSYCYDYRLGVPQFSSDYESTVFYKLYEHKAYLYERKCVKHKEMNDELTDLFNPDNLIKNSKPPF